jgi:hypothetical protein
MWPQRPGGSEGCRGVGVHLMGLANSTACDEGADKHIEAWPPKVQSYKILGSENAAVAPGSRLMEGGDNVVVSPLGNIEAPLKVELPILVKPLLPMGMGEKRGSLIEGLESGEHKGVGGGGQGDFISEGNINGTGEKVVGEQHELLIVVGRVDVVMVGEGISGTHLSPRCMMEVQVKILQEQIPACLSVRQLMRLVEVHKVLVVH